MPKIAALSCAVLVACGQASASGDDDGPSSWPKGGSGAGGARAAPYDSCYGARPCASTCIVIPSGREVCSLPCETTAECPLPADVTKTTDLTGVECVQGQCRPYRCTATTTDHNVLVAPNAICFRGEVVACDSLEPRPCACECSVGTFCDSESAECVPSLEDGAACNADEQCLSTYCDPTSVFAGTCKAPVGSACVAGETQCTCHAPAAAAVGYCTGSCYVTADSTCICRAEGFVSTGTSCLRRCLAQPDCEPWEQCQFESGAALHGVCSGPTFVPI
jgi:hypothetical protein